MTLKYCEYRLMRVFLKLSNKMYQNHIENRTSGDREKHLAFPEMNDCRRNDGENLRCTVCAMKKVNVFQAVYDKHTKDCGRKIFSNVLDKCGCLPFLREDKKWKKAGCHCRKDA